MAEEKIKPEQEKRIRAEVRKLNAVYKNLDKAKKAIADGLIKRAAFLRVSLEDMEEDIKENGLTESFKQSEKLEPYERERPVSKIYSTMNKNYQTISKQLSDLAKEIPKESPSDGFDEFVNEED